MVNLQAASALGFQPLHTGGPPVLHASVAAVAAAVPKKRPRMPPVRMPAATLPTAALPPVLGAYATEDLSSKDTSSTDFEERTRHAFYAGKARGKGKDKASKGKSTGKDKKTMKVKKGAGNKTMKVKKEDGDKPDNGSDIGDGGEPLTAV